MLLGVGIDGSRPTFFELVAAERLMPSLRSALSYSFAVLAQRRPWIHRILDREDECFALFTFLLERHSLRSGDGSFSEGLYGLKRVSVLGAGGELLGKQRALALAMLVGAPYLKAKLERLHGEMAGGPGGLPSLPALQLAAPLEPNSQQDDAATRRGVDAGGGQGGALVAHGAGGLGALAESARGLAHWLRGAVARLFLLGYPHVHAFHESARFAYQLLYLVGSSEYFSPGLQLLGMVIARVSGDEVAEAARREEGRRAAELSAARARGGDAWPARAARAARLLWLRAGHASADHMRNGLILTVFGFKLLEWWYSSVEERLAPQSGLPPPPPPPPMKPAAGGCGLPEDRSLCPLCRRPRATPAVAAASGYVFCYPCVVRYVEEWGRCPVTLAPTSTEGIRRLYIEP